MSHEKTKMAPKVSKMKKTRKKPIDTHPSLVIFCADNTLILNVGQI